LQNDDVTLDFDSEEEAAKEGKNMFQGKNDFS
jgi:hypothetical protein